MLDVLIVEDNTTFRKSLNEMLTDRFTDMDNSFDHDAFMDKAIELFRRNGILNVSLEEIAKQANISMDIILLTLYKISFNCRAAIVPILT